MGNKAAKTTPLTEGTKQRAVEVFEHFDLDKSHSIEKDECIKHWKSNFSKLNTMAMFEAVDANGDGTIELDEWIAFWEIVKGAGHDEEEILEELDNIISGGSWVGFDNLPLAKTKSKSG
mmetsp:Transcript_34876/g.39542  ORF Transcript_34876/g.39542 Transcript_34876/m.39542 type:complete len:119 (-) Transcript_34876:137-493(-)